MKRVVVTGAGVVSSVGQDVSTYAANMLGGVLVTDPAPWAESAEKGPWVAAVRDFDPHAWMNERVVGGTDVFAQYAIAATTQALADAAIESPDPMRTAVVLGTSMAGVKSLLGAQQALDERGPSAVPRKVQIQAWANMAGGQIALRYGLHGPLLAVSTACAASTDAIGHAARLIEAGIADVAICGGSESAMTPALAYSQQAYGMQAAAAAPELVSRPFDVNRKGILEGEGGGVLILESVEHAKARGATIKAYVRGYSAISDAFHPSSPDPSGQWEALAIRQALDQADLPAGPAGIDAVVAHGTGTQVGDSAEIRAINSVFAGTEPPLVASTKGHIGHTGGASGVMSVIAAIEAANAGAWMPTVGCVDVDPEADFPVVTEKAATADVRAYQVNSFGFGGQNSSLVLSRDA